MISPGGRRLVMMIGTLKRTQASMSCISLSFDACTIWFTA